MRKTCSLLTILFIVFFSVADFSFSETGIEKKAPRVFKNQYQPHINKTAGADKGSEEQSCRKTNPDCKIEMLYVNGILKKIDIDKKTAEFDMLNLSCEGKKIFQIDEKDIEKLKNAIGKEIYFNVEGCSKADKIYTIYDISVGG